MVEIRTTTRKKFLAVGKACMAILNILTYSRRENICQLKVLNRGDLNLCVHNTLLWKSDRYFKYHITQKLVYYYYTTEYDNILKLCA